MLIDVSVTFDCGSYPIKYVISHKLFFHCSLKDSGKNQHGNKPDKCKDGRVVMHWRSLAEVRIQIALSLGKRCR